MNEELARTLDELRARAASDGTQSEGVELLLETIHADEHAGAHSESVSRDDGVSAIVRHRRWLKRNPP